MSDHTIPLPVSEAPCWRCGAPSTRQGLRYDLCETCKVVVAEIATVHQQPPPAHEGEDA